MIYKCVVQKYQCADILWSKFDKSCLLYYRNSPKSNPEVYVMIIILLISALDIILLDIILLDIILLDMFNQQIK